MAKATTRSTGFIAPMIRRHIGDIASINFRNLHVFERSEFVTLTEGPTVDFADVSNRGIFPPLRNLPEFGVLKVIGEEVIKG